MTRITDENRVWDFARARPASEVLPEILGASIAAEALRPKDEQCQWCGEAFIDGEPFETYLGGQRAHIECALRSVAGGINHQRGLCIWCGGSLPPDPPELTRRDAAREAWREFQSRARRAHA